MIVTQVSPSSSPYPHPDPGLPLEDLQQAELMAQRAEERAAAQAALEKAAAQRAEQEKREEEMRAAAERAEMERVAAERAAVLAAARKKQQERAQFEMDLEAAKREIRDSVRLPGHERKLALRNLQLKWHPDRHSRVASEDETMKERATELMQAINEAMRIAKLNAKARNEL